MRKCILTNMKKAIFDFKLIDANDKICVGVSGGKDSMALLHALNAFRKYSPIPFTIVAINLDLGFNDMDFSELIAYFKKNEIEFYRKPTKVAQILALNPNKDGSLKCSICSRMKKALIIEAALEHQCTKIAFAHHGDDAVETLFLNAIFGGKLATFKPKTYMSRTDTTFIRPFVYVRESEISGYLESEKIPVVINTCPNDGKTKRSETKELLKSIYQKNPCAYENFLIMLSNQEQLDLWEKIE